MRHFLAHTLDLQDEDPITGESQAEQADRSPEEDAQAAVEATTELADANTAMGDVVRYSEVADALEDTAAIMDTVDETTPAHVALVQTVANMAAAGAGEGVTGDDVVPGLDTQHYIGRRMSTEGFKDAAKRIWETIKRWVKKIWAKIEGFFYKHFGRIPRMRKSLEAAEKQLTGAESRPLEDKKIDLTTGLSQMVVNNGDVKDYKEYNTALSALAGAVSDVFKIAAKKLADGGEALSEAISDFDISKAGDSLVNINNALGACIPGAGSMNSIKGSTGFAGATSPDGVSCSYSAPLPGNIMLRFGVTTTQSASRSEANAVAQITHAHRNTGVVAVYPEKARDTPSSVSINTPTIDQVRASIGQCRRMLDDMETFYRGKGFKDIKTAQDKITKAGDKISAQVSKVKPEDLGEDDLAFFRQTTGTASSFVQKTLRTFGGISTTAMTSCSFVCTVASKTSSAYRNK